MNIGEYCKSRLCPLILFHVQEKIASVTVTEYSSGKLGNWMALVIVVFVPQYCYLFAGEDCRSRLCSLILFCVGEDRVRLHD